MLEYDPDKRISAQDAMRHVYFAEDMKPGSNSFAVPGERNPMQYPVRRVMQDDTDMSSGASSVKQSRGEEKSAKRQRI